MRKQENVIINTYSFLFVSMPFVTAVAGYGEPSTLSLVCVSSSYRFDVNSSYTYTKQKLVFSPSLSRFLSLSLFLLLFLFDFFFCSPLFIRPRRLLELLRMFFSNCFTTFIFIYFDAIALKILATTTTTTRFFIPT